MSIKFFSNVIIFLLIQVFFALAQTDSRNVFSLLNLEYPGLEKVKQAYESGNIELANVELLTYFQQRTNRKVLEPGKIHKANIERADRNCENKFNIKQIFQDFGPKINWTKVQADKEWQFSLGRMKWFDNYIGTYQKTGNEKYVKAWMRQIESWLELNDPGYPRTIDTGRRMQYLIDSHWMFVNELKSASVTPEFNAKLLLSLWQQSEFIYNPDQWRRYSNWGTFENSGFAKMAIMYPEFKRSQLWLREIFFRMDVQLDRSFHPDGMHIEVSPSYHSHELEVWFHFLQLAQLNDVENPWHSQIPIPSFKSKLLKQAFTMMHWYKPTGMMPQVGDTDDSDERGLLYDIGKEWEQPGLIYAATSGKEGQPHSQTSVAYPDGGYSIMRGGWGEKNLNYQDELYLLFDTGTNAPWHAHFDALNIVATAYGYDILKDSGRFTYNDGPDRDAFKSTASHNTIVIDGEDQPNQYVPPKADWVSLSGFDYASGKNNYHPLVSHQRSIFFAKPEYWIIVDKISGEGIHSYDQYWHLSDKSLNKVQIDPDSRIITAPHLQMINLNFSAQIDLDEGYLSYSYRNKVKAPVIRNHIRSDNVPAWVIILYPYQNEPREITTHLIEVQSVKPNPEAVAFRMLTKNNTDFFFQQTENGTDCTMGDFKTDAKLVWVQFDKNKIITSYSLLGGSYLHYKNKAIAAVTGKNIAMSVSENQVDVSGENVVELELKVLGNPKLIINSNKEKARVEQGILYYSICPPKS